MTSASTKDLPLVWELESIFKNSGTEDDFNNFISKLKANLEKLKQSIEQKQLKSTLAISDDIETLLHQLSAYGHCLFAENTQNPRAPEIGNLAKDLYAQYQALNLDITNMLAELSDEDFNALVSESEFKNVVFPLEEKRSLAKQLLPLELEKLITKLEVSGYHGHGQLYSTAHSALTFPYDDEGKTKNLSFGQVDNKLSSSDRAERIKAFRVVKDVFSKNEDLFATTLNNIAGFRLGVYEKRGWDSALYEPLFLNRMKQETLDAMWDGINEFKNHFTRFYKKKAQMLGVDSLSWHDIDAPISKVETKTPYDEAAEFIVKNFSQYSNNMASYSKRALSSAWIEAEDREKKAAGGFCVGFPINKESRIFMTYSGEASNVSTLAHELGHAYHNEILYKLPHKAQDLRMNVAETASTMAEQIVAEANLAKANSNSEKIAILDDRISTALVYFLNIQTRFLFETRFYEERKKGFVNAKRLSEIMETAQKESFGDILSDTFPHFWASKMHFFITEYPFYNFPYTFGYLFSLGIFSFAKDHPDNFEGTWDRLLSDTCLMNVEDLAKKHLNIDLTEKEFWKSAVSEIVQNIEQFLDLTEK